MAKGNPIPTKFDPEEEKLLKWVARKSGLSLSEVIRRAVRFFNQEVQRRGENVGWIIEELGPRAEPMPVAPVSYPRLVAENPNRTTEDPPPDPKTAPAKRAVKR